MGIRMAPRVFHKPQKSGTGKALKIELRLAPVWVQVGEQDGYWDKDANKDGGLFLELVPQSGTDGAGNATFAWTDPLVLRVKLGVPDMGGLLASYRQYRLGTGGVPVSLQAKQNPSPTTAQFFHKTATGSTVITYSFEEDSSSLRLSKSKDQFASIKLSVPEELVLMRYLELSLDRFLEVGKR